MERLSSGQWVSGSTEQAQPRVIALVILIFHSFFNYSSSIPAGEAQIYFD